MSTELPNHPIDQVNYEKTQAAYKQVFEDAASFEEYSDFDADAAAALMAETGYSDQIDSVNTALDARRQCDSVMF